MPVLGQILDAALAVFIIAVNIRKMYDIHRTYGAEEETALIIAIIGQFVPLAYAIYLLMIMKKEPDYGFGNYEAGNASGEFTEI